MKNKLLLIFVVLFVLSLSIVSAEEQTCIETDGGVDFFNFGTLINHSITGTNLVDVCLTGSNYLFERHCESSDPNNYTVLVDCADFGATCENGACIPEPSNATCTDTDGGLDFYNKGTLTEHPVVAGLEDSCIPFSTEVLERFCDINNPYNYTMVYDCPNGCENGACIPEPSNATCVDSDGGLNIFESGILNLSNDHSSGTLEDTCTGIDEGLAEYVCLADGCGYQVVYSSTLRLDPKYMLVYDNGNCEYATANWGYNVDCATEGNVCVDGACVPELEPTCSNLGGEICEYGEYCQGINMTDSNEAKCCDGTCKPLPPWAVCSQCGAGLFNECDRLECETLNPLVPRPNYGCVFTPIQGDAKGKCADAPCTSDWQPGNWSEWEIVSCNSDDSQEEIRYRDYFDSNRCKISDNYPGIENESRIVENGCDYCTPEWECSSWGKCGPEKKIISGYGYGYGYSFLQTRECTDINSCDENDNKPAEEQTCTRANERSGNHSRFFWNLFDPIN